MRVTQEKSWVDVAMGGVERGLRELVLLRQFYWEGFLGRGGNGEEEEGAWMRMRRRRRRRRLGSEEEKDGGSAPCDA